jgi:hypothetical protein
VAWFLRAGGHQFSRLVAVCSPGGAGLGCQRDHPFAGGGLGEAVRVALGQDQAGVVEQSTVAVARVLGMIESKPEGWMLLVTATERRS